MKTINYQQVPSTVADDFNTNKSKWENNLYVSLDEGRFITRFIGHNIETIISEDGREVQITVAYPVRVEKPYTIDKAVSAAIMDAYGLSAGELPAFLEDISRKHRQNSNDPDVMEFDYFVEWVRCSLDGTYATKLDEVKAEVLAKIDAYDTSSEVNSFSLNGLPVWLDKDTRVGLMNSTQIEKAAGHETTTLWLGSVNLVINCDLAIQLLSALELYALECYNKTAEHKANVGKLTSIEEVEAYDYTIGYPDKLNLNTSGV